MLPAIVALLEAKTGIDAKSIGAAAIERAVRERMAAGGLTDAEAYWKHLRISGEEQQRLTEAVVVSETWFFRNPEAFAALVRIVTAEWLPAHPTGLLRVLSAACATGEEPYSIAMALLDSGLSAERFAIDAVDISTRAIAHAQEGVYGRNSFRGSDLTFRDRYFEHTAAGYRLSSRVRAPVQLRSANLFTAGTFGGVECYDIVFCRNVLIYFDRPVQRKAVEILQSLMTADGVMFVGPAESALLTESGLTPARMPHAFAFRRTREVPAKPQPSLRTAAAARPSSPQEFHPSRPLAQAQRSSARNRAAMTGRPAAPTPATADSATAPGEVPWMERARQLADQGKLADALRVCEQGLQDSEPSAQAFYLLGLLHDAAGRPQQAGEHYRKALYLDPTHAEALVQLAALLKCDGDTGGAERLLERARRARATEGG